MNDMDRHIAKWTEENKPIGELLGYPECCIREFCQQPPIILQSTAASEDDKIRYQAACINGKFTGFIPCIAHARQIVNGKIRLQDLIDLTKRDNRLPEFPKAFNKQF
jgi:hypothetical protein